jgi:hypothetical protein
MRQRGAMGAPIIKAERAWSFRECITTKRSEEEKGIDFKKGNRW